ncbi:hypothetical protein JCM10212_005404 [Sporobolomyces blumeae]
MPPSRHELPPGGMKSVDRDEVRNDLHARVAFARDFLGFTEADGKALNAAAPLVALLVHSITDEVYLHLFEYSYTKAFFLKRHVGFDGELPTNLESYTVDHPQMKFRKTFLTTYLTKVFVADYEDDATYEYLDKVAAMHTGLKMFGKNQRDDPIIVDLQPMSLLLGWVESVVIKAILEVPKNVLSLDVKCKTVRALNKIIWIQNDLFNRYYAKSDVELMASTQERAQASSKDAKKRFGW